MNRRWILIGGSAVLLLLMPVAAHLAPLGALALIAAAAAALVAIESLVDRADRRAVRSHHDELTKG